jgi:hypothetical protein
MTKPVVVLRSGVIGDPGHIYTGRLDEKSHLWGYFLCTRCNQVGVC